jgi:PAS domain S-box-containing protein
METTLPPETERQKLYDELRKFHSLLRATLEATADGILVIDRHGRIVSYNARFAYLWRVPLDVLERRDDDHAIAHVLDQLEDPEQFLRKVRELYSAPEAESFDVLRFKDGRVFERRSLPQRLDGQVVGRVWSFYDVTARDRAEAEKSEAIEARDQMLSIASHELKAPLTSMLLKLQMIRLGLEQPRAENLRTRRLLDQAIAQTERMAKLIDSLFDLSKLRSSTFELTREATDLCRLVHEVADRFSADLAQAGCALEIDCHYGELVGRWDRMRVEQLLTNLLSNAMKFGRGHPVRVEVRPEKDDRVEIRVRDGGIGIRPEDQERIFDRFERAGSLSRDSGMGLGLYIARRIVTAHGGSIRVESAPGSGATFIVSLPIEAEAAADERVRNLH